MAFDPRKFREEKEKEINATYGSLRKRSFKFLVLNVMIVVTIFFFLLFLNRVSPQTYSNIVDSLQLTVELTKLEYLAPESVGARIYVVNTKKNEKNFVISDFYVKVYSQNKTLYEFSHQTPVQGSVSALSKRLVFDLEKEVTLRTLEEGSYNIFVSCKINGKVASITRSFVYKEEIKYDILTEPFYLLNEEIKPYFVIENRTNRKQSFEIEKIEWRYGKETKETYTQPIAKTIHIYPLELEMIQSMFKFKVSEDAEKELEAFLYLSDGSVKQVRILVPVTKSFERGIEAVDFSIDVTEPVVVGKPSKINLYIINLHNGKRYLNIKKLSASIPSIGYNFEIGNRRIYLIPFGKSFVTRLEKLNFEKPGVYELILTIEVLGTKGDFKRQKKLTIAVGN